MPASPRHAHTYLCAKRRLSLVQGSLSVNDFLPLVYSINSLQLVKKVCIDIILATLCLCNCVYSARSTDTLVKLHKPINRSLPYCFCWAPPTIEDLANSSPFKPQPLFTQVSTQTIYTVVVLQCTLRNSRLAKIVDPQNNYWLKLTKSTNTKAKMISWSVLLTTYWAIATPMSAKTKSALFERGQKCY